MNPKNKKQKTTSYLLRLTPQEKQRWQQIACSYNLPLSELIRKRMESRPVTPPCVPAINVKVSLQMGQFDLSLRHLRDDILQTIKVILQTLPQQQSISINQHQQLTVMLAEVQDLLRQVRDQIREVRLTLSGAKHSDGNTIDSTEVNTSTLAQEDWD